MEEEWKVFPSVNVSYLTNDGGGCWMRCWMRMPDALLLTLRFFGPSFVRLMFHPLRR